MTQNYFDRAVNTVVSGVTLNKFGVRRTEAFEKIDAESNMNGL